MLPVLHLLGHRLGRVTLVRVLDFESMNDDEERAPEKHAAADGFDAVIVVDGSQRATPRKGPGSSHAVNPEPAVLVVADAPHAEPRA